MDRITFNELRINYRVNTAFWYSTQIKKYKEGIKQSREYPEKLKYDSWIAAAETKIIEAANEIIEILSERN